MIKIPIDNIELEGDLAIPKGAVGLVIFAHGSGSSRQSPRNKFVAKEFNKDKLATLLIDLLTKQEDEDYEIRYNIELLTKRLLAITDWVKQNNKINHLSIGYFGSSTGAAATVFAADGRKDIVKTIVSRGGRVDLAYDTIHTLKIPILLIVGGEDYSILDANRDVFDRIKSEKDLKIIPKATHLFKEPGALEDVAKLASDWFRNNLKS